LNFVSPLKRGGKKGVGNHCGYIACTGKQREIPLLKIGGGKRGLFTPSKVSEALNGPKEEKKALLLSQRREEKKGRSFFCRKKKG